MTAKGLVSRRLGGRFGAGFDGKDGGKQEPYEELVIDGPDRKNGYEVTACSTGEEAWQAFRQAPMRYDLLVTDLSMPVLDGASLIQRVRLLHPRLRALLISGYCDDGQAYDLVKSGAVGFLPKPFNTSEFLSFVRGQMEAA